MIMTTTTKSKVCGFRPSSLLVASSLFFGVLLSGCDDAPEMTGTVDVKSLQQQLISESPLENEQMVSEIRKQLEAEGVEEVDVVVKGRINAGKEDSPWEPDKAAFVLTDAIGHEGEQDHDPHTCPFCSRNINDYLVMVSFPDDDGQLIDVDSRELFKVTDNQLVYVKGTAEIDPDDGLLYLNAVQLHTVTDQ